MSINSNNFLYCPKCGTKDTIQYIEKYWKCDKCSFILYHNAASASAVIISDNENNILFEIRAKDPKKGMLGCPGVLLILMKLLKKMLLENAKKK